MIMLTDITKRFADRVILNKLSYHFPAGERIALVGANGAGKTTLLNIICELEETDGGSMIRPKNCVLGYLPQEPNPEAKSTIWEECLDGAYRIQDLSRQRQDIAERMMTSPTDDLFDLYQKAEDQFQALGGYELEGLAHKVLTGLGFREHQWQQDPHTLSGGWRMRLELARVLVNEPDFLVLDEPTNHLDLPSLQWLETYLMNYPGTLLFVSHDQDLLNRLSTITLYLNQGLITSYRGNFDKFMEYKELQDLQNKSQAKRLEQRAAEVQRFIDRFRAKASKAKQVGSRVKMLSRLRDLESSIPEDRPLDEVVIRLDAGVPSGKNALKLTGVTIGYDKPLLRRLNMLVTRGEKIAITGANGLGKSTLLKTIVGNIPTLAGELTLGSNTRLGYFSQDQIEMLNPSLTVIEQLMQSAPQLSEREARSALGSFLFPQDDSFKKISVLSGGERSRLAFCCLVVNKPNFLILDEPTNHLDMTSTTILADALAEFEGTVVFVSHSRQFIRQVATTTLGVSEQGNLEPIVV